MEAPPPLLATLGLPLGCAPSLGAATPQPPSFTPRVARWINVADRDDFAPTAPDLIHLFTPGQPTEALLEGGSTIDNGAEPNAPRSSRPSSRPPTPSGNPSAAPDNSRPLYQVL
jgi:hypothetical protein